MSEKERERERERERKRAKASEREFTQRFSVSVVPEKSAKLGGLPPGLSLAENSKKNFSPKNPILLIRFVISP